MLAVIDYGMGNLRSVTNAFSGLGCDAFIARQPEELRRAEMIVLPGVGAFGDGMSNLNAAGWTEALEQEVRVAGKPFLGICLGMQLLATTGTEHGTHKGLNWIPGVSRRLSTDSDPALRLPHIGWNDVHFLKREGLFDDTKESDTFYFVHSYILVPEDISVASSFSNHGEDFITTVESGNIFAAQFHPEKSHKAGLRLLGNFLKMAAKSACLKSV